MEENEYEYEEPSWLRELMITIQLLSLVSTYAILMVGLIIIDLVRPLGFDLAEMSIVSFLISALAGILTLLVRVLHARAEGRRKIFAAVIYSCVGITVLGCVWGILSFVGFILL